MPYLLDANVFIQAKNLHYGMDFCPAFWDWLIEGNAAKQVFSIEKVGDEILAIADELAVWADDRGSDFFLKPDAALLPALGSASNASLLTRCCERSAHVSFWVRLRNGRQRNQGRQQALFVDGGEA